MRFDYLYCLKYYKNVFKHINTFNWEILSLILIYCSKMLELFNRQKFEREQMESGNNDDFNKNMIEGEENNVVNEEKKDNENMSQISHQTEKSKKSQATNQSKKSKNEEEKNNNEENNEEQPQENNNNENENEENHNKLESLNGIEGIEKDPHIEEENKKIQEELNHRINEIQKCENEFLSIIDHIFSLPSPHMTIKIGFIYLAEVLEYYPELAKKYMKLLIEYKDNTIRKEVLLVEQSSEEYEYTINCYTERYKFCGAPYFWNQLKIAGIFRDYVLENLERFESNHLLILHSIIIHQEFNESDAEDWINLYNDLKKYLFVALCEKQFSGVALSILDKIFSFTKILQNLLDHTFDLFINTMKIIYGDDVMDEPHKNMKTLLTTISEIKAEGVDCKTYVYTLIKTFAIQNDKKYLKSNLLDLLNSIYFEKRGNIFEDEPKN
jgi:flagellar biosynthesis GTPase FlhF